MLPPGTLAYREYEVPAPDGGKARYAFTLGDKAAETIQGKFARQKGSHCSFTKAGERTIVVPQVHGRKVKRYILDQIIERLGLE